MPGQWDALTLVHNFQQERVFLKEQAGKGALQSLAKCIAAASEDPAARPYPR